MGATNEVTFTVAYVDGNADAFPANTGSIAAYNAQTGGASSGYAARALFGCAAMELALGGTAAKAGDSDGQCIVQTVGHKTATTAGYKNGGVSITSTSVKLLNTNSDNSMPWATISSVASAQVTNGFTITFTMKFVPNALAAATVKTEAEIATAVNAITAANFNTALTSVVTNGDGRVNALDYCGRASDLPLPMAVLYWLARRLRQILGCTMDQILLRTLWKPPTSPLPTPCLPPNPRSAIRQPRRALGTSPPRSPTVPSTAVRRPCLSVPAAHTTAAAATPPMRSPRLNAPHQAPPLTWCPMSAT